MSLPYENASSGSERAMAEAQKILQKFGCTSFGHLADFEHGKVLIQFQYRDRKIQVEASINGYAAAWLREHPHTHRTRISKIEHERKAKTIAGFAVYSLLRDWIKGQMTAIETGILTFEGAFLGQILLPNGRTILQHAEEQKLLTAPEEENT